MDDILLAAARDTLTRAAHSFDRLIVATADRDWAASLSDLDVEIDLDRADVPFHFGQRLADLVARLHLERIAYSGPASAPLLSGADWSAIATALRSTSSVVITNNLYSSDWAAIDPAQAIVTHAGRLHADNAMGWVLSHEGGLTAQVWPRSARTSLDIDTPVDALIAVQHPAAGEKLRAAVDASGWSREHIAAAREVMRIAEKRLTLIGRVPSYTTSLLEQKTRCWVRVFSEERGMHASGRQTRGEVQSLLARYIDAVGIARFFDDVAEMSDAALLDSRVILAAKQIWPDAEDRFASDLLLPNVIRDPFLRDFTRAAAERSIPIVLGGHSLVSAGLWALLEG
jgi:hypothetical protein